MVNTRDADDGQTIAVRYPALEREDSLASRVSAHLEELIVSNQLAPGAKLPSERYLADQYHVSRTVIREAVRSLAAKGLIAVQAGSGTVVRGGHFASATESMSLLLNLGMNRGEIDLAKIAEVRRVLEVEIAGLAAERASSDDIAALDLILAEATADANDEATFIRTDLAFHQGLARATQNELFVVILDSIGDVLVTVRRIGWQVPGVAERALTHHRHILVAIRQGDPAAARAAMDRHMDEARETMALGLGRAIAD